MGENSRESSNKLIRDSLTGKAIFVPNALLIVIRLRFYTAFNFVELKPWNQKNSHSYQKAQLRSYAPRKSESWPFTTYHELGLQAHQILSFNRRLDDKDPLDMAIQGGNIASVKTPLFKGEREKKKEKIEEKREE